MSILGYARVSTGDQDLAGQKRRRQAAGAYRVFEDVISGKTFQRTVLADLFDHLCPNDSLAVVRLDRLGRSLRELLDVVEDLQKREVAILSLEEKLDTSSAFRQTGFSRLRRARAFRAAPLAERTCDGMNAARAKGSRAGRPPLNPEPVLRSKPIPSTVREATYVLDGILDNETELPIAEHTSDTAGFVQPVGVIGFDLVGDGEMLQFWHEAPMTADDSSR